ncbi:MAG: transketolase family protein [Bacteroidota bacterium]
MPSLRDAYGRTLVELAKTDDRIVVLDADLSKATRSMFMKQEVPNRYFEMGIAEGNMVSVAAGLALTGKISFANSFTTFLIGRAYDQIRVGVALAKTNVKLVGASSGLSNYGDGATHQSVEDVNMLRALPNITIIMPADSVETAKAVKAAAEWDGPVFIRLPRTDDVPDILGEDYTFEIGRPKLIREGSDTTIFACGFMVHKALEAADALATEGVDVAVVNVSTIKPLDKEVVYLYAQQTGSVVTAEEHSVIGGLGSAISEALEDYREIPIVRVGINDQFGQSAPSYEDLLRAYGLTVESIVKAVRKAMASKVCNRRVSHIDE